MSVIFKTVIRGSRLSILANASDAGGVKQVQFYINGGVVCTVSSTPYSCSWKIPRTKRQSYQIKAMATDTAGNIGYSSIVTVNAK